MVIAAIGACAVAIIYSRYRKVEKMLVMDHLPETVEVIALLIQECKRQLSQTLLLPPVCCCYPDSCCPSLVPVLLCLTCADTRRSTPARIRKKSLRFRLRGLA